MMKFTPEKLIVCHDIVPVVSNVFPDTSLSSTPVDDAAMSERVLVPIFVISIFSRRIASIPALRPKRPVSWFVILEILLFDGGATVAFLRFAGLTTSTRRVAHDPFPALSTFI